MEWITMSTNPSEGNSSTTGTPLADSHQPSGQSLFSWAANRSSSSGPQKIRVTILCARSLVKRDLFRLPDPFVKVSLKFATRALTRTTFRIKSFIWFYKQHWKFSSTFPVPYDLNILKYSCSLSMGYVILIPIHTWKQILATISLCPIIFTLVFLVIQ